MQLRGFENYGIKIMEMVTLIFSSFPTEQIIRLADLNEKKKKTINKKYMASPVRLTTQILDPRRNLMTCLFVLGEH